MVGKEVRIKRTGYRTRNVDAWGWGIVHRKRATAQASTLSASAGTLIWRTVAAPEMGLKPELAAPAACAGAEEAGGAAELAWGPPL
jgi:hypothetical protein